MPHHRSYDLDPYNSSSYNQQGISQYGGGGYSSYLQHQETPPSDEDVDEGENGDDEVVEEEDVEAQDVEEDEQDEDDDDENEDELEDDQDELEEEEDDNNEEEIASEHLSVPSRPYSNVEDDEDVDEEETEDDEENYNSSVLPEDEEEDKEPPRKRPKSLAFAFLQGQTTHIDSTLSHSARGILKSLLEEQGFVHKESETDVTAALALLSKRRPENEDDSAVLLEASNFSDDANIVRLTKKRNSQVSYLKTFLAVLEQELSGPYGAGVPARVLIQRSCLAICPQYIPAAFDAEEMAMAALEFLGSSYSAQSPLLPNLPLIQALKEENDIKKRIYVKAGQWELDTLPLRLLESVFFQDATSYQWLRRVAFAPRSVDENEEDTLFRKGKHKSVTAPPKKKSAAATAVAGTKHNATIDTTPSSIASSTMQRRSSFSAAIDDETAGE